MYTNTMISNIIALSICIIFLGITLLALFLSRNSNSKHSKWFSYIIYSTILYLAISIVTEAFEGHAELSKINYVINVFSFLAIDVIFIAFLGYVRSLIIGEKNKATKLLSLLLLLTVTIRVIMICVLSGMGKLFMINTEGKYVEAELISIPYIIAAVIMVEFIGLIIVNRKYFTTRQFVVILVYTFIPVVAIIVESVTNYYFITGLGLTISGLLIYLLIQDSVIEENIIKQNILEEMSNQDLLTGLNNRSSYYETLKKMANSNVGVIFSDINGLKYINDHYGHSAGDELIIKYSKILIDEFGQDCSFRISGDEFIVIVKYPKNLDFERRFNEFNKVIIANNHIAAIGASYGTGDNIEKLVIEAESEMYKNKSLYGLKR